MPRFRPALLLAALILSTGAFRGQATGVLHIKVTLAGADQAVRPIPRAALLISDTPATSAPRRIVTGPDGTANVTLRAGAYIVESDQPVNFQGKAYQWTQAVTIKAGQDAVLDLNAGNAEVAAAAAGGPAEVDLASLFDEWQSSVVTVWSQTSNGLGFLIDANGLIATNQQIVGSSQSAEVQLTPATKVAARIVVSNPEKHVAILWVDPKAVASIRPVRLGFAEGGSALHGLTTGQQVFGVGSPLNGRKFMTTGTVSGVGAREIESDIVVDPGNAGGPLFGQDAQVVGITTLGPRRAEGPPIVTVVRIDEARGAIAEAQGKVRSGSPPSGALLPVEPARPYSEDALKAAVQGRATNTIDYQLKAADFDVTFITPVVTYGVHYREQQADVRVPGTRTRTPGPSQDRLRSIDSFENWAEYAASFPPVLMIRATPKLVEGFWSVVGRQAAQTQGIYLPPGTKHAKAGFLKMRAYCGDAEVTPIHPFKIEHRFAADSSAGNANDVTYEGLYVFDPGALGPQCTAVKLVLFSEKDPEKGDPRVVEPKTVQQIWQDFAAWR